MGSKLIVCLLIFGFVYSVLSAQWQTKPYQHPDHPGQCYDKETNEPVSVGQLSSNLKGCLWMQCQPDFSFKISSCGPVGPPKGCIATTPDLSKPYPKCCPQLICNQSD